MCEMFQSVIKNISKKQRQVLKEDYKDGRSLRLLLHLSEMGQMGYQ